ncbi:hypothetical protein DSUL_130020 [Desulfovibrionales bacterium]
MRISFIVLILGIDGYDTKADAEVKRIKAVGVINLHGMA